MTPTRNFAKSLPLLLLVAVVASAGSAQTRATRPPDPKATSGQATADQPPPAGADLFRPMPQGDLSPEQQRALEKFRADPSTGPIQVFRVNLNVPMTADAVNINLLPGDDMMLSTRNRTDRAAGDYSWTGGDATRDQSAALVVKGQQVSGTIRNGDKLYRVRPIGGGATAVIEVDQKKLPPEHPPAFDRKQGEKSPPKPAPATLRRREAAPRAGAAVTRAAVETRDTRADAPGSGGASGGGASGPATGPAADECGTIDVFVAYTSTAESESGAIDALVQLAIDETNNSYANSGIVPRLRLVGQERVDYTESGDMELDVARLANPADGFLDDVPTLRDSHNADLVVLITGNGNFCGIAADILAGADNAYAVVGQNCATGYYSFGHEIGHLQGARHNPEADPTPTPFAFGHGFFSTANRKRTVMSYDCPMGCTRVDVWADPAVTVAGVAMGDPDLHHDARVLNETACSMAGFRSSGEGGSGFGGGGTGTGTGGTETGGTGTGGTGTGGTGSSSGGSGAHSAPSFSTWSLVALALFAPLFVRRRSRA